MKKLVYCDETTDIVGPGIEMIDKKGDRQTMLDIVVLSAKI